MDGDAGMKARHCPEKRSLLQAETFHRLGAEGRTERFVAAGRGTHRTEAVLLVYRPPSPPTGLSTVAGESLRIESEVDVDTVLAVAGVQLAEVPRSGVVVPRPGPEIVGSCFRNGRVHFVLVVLVFLLLFRTSVGAVFFVGLLAVLVVRRGLLSYNARRKVCGCTVLDLTVTERGE